MPDVQRQRTTRPLPLAHKRTASSSTTTTTTAAAATSVPRYSRTAKQNDTTTTITSTTSDGHALLKSAASHRNSAAVRPSEGTLPLATSTHSSTKAHKNSIGITSRVTNGRVADKNSITQTNTNSNGFAVHAVFATKNGVVAGTKTTELVTSGLKKALNTTTMVESCEGQDSSLGYTSREAAEPTGSDVCNIAEDTVRDECEVMVLVEEEEGEKEKHESEHKGERCEEEEATLCVCDRDGQDSPYSSQKMCCTSSLTRSGLSSRRNSGSLHQAAQHVLNCHTELTSGNSHGGKKVGEVAETFVMEANGLCRSSNEEDYKNGKKDSTPEASTTHTTSGGGRVSGCDGDEAGVTKKSTSTNEIHKAVHEASERNTVKEAAVIGEGGTGRNTRGSARTLTRRSLTNTPNPHTLSASTSSGTTVVRNAAPWSMTRGNYVPLYARNYARRNTHNNYYNTNATTSSSSHVGLPMSRASVAAAQVMQHRHTVPDTLTEDTIIVKVKKSNADSTTVQKAHSEEEARLLTQSTAQDATCTTSSHVTAAGHNNKAVDVHYEASHLTHSGPTSPNLQQCHTTTTAGSTSRRTLGQLISSTSSSSATPGAAGSNGHNGSHGNGSSAGPSEQANNNTHGNNHHNNNNNNNNSNNNGGANGPGAGEAHNAGNGDDKRRPRRGGSESESESDEGEGQKSRSGSSSSSSSSSTSSDDMSFTTCTSTTTTTTSEQGKGLRRRQRRKEMRHAKGMSEKNTSSTSKAQHDLRSAMASDASLRITPEVSRRLCALVDHEIVAYLVPSLTGLNRRRTQLRCLAESITEAIRNVGQMQGRQYGSIRYYIFGSVNMRTVLPDGDNDITIEVDGLLPDDSGVIADTSTALRRHPTTKNYTTEVQKQQEEQTGSDAQDTAKKATRTMTSTATQTNTSNTPTPATTTTSSTTALLPVTTDSNGANKEGTLQFTTLQDGRPMVAPPVAIAIAGGDLLTRVRDYLMRCANSSIYVDALVMAEVRVLKVIMAGSSYDITISQFGGVNCVRFLHEMDALIGHEHLLKRTLLLLKSWCCYEAHVLGGQGGYIGSYAATIMLIAMINTVEFLEDVVPPVENTESDDEEEEEEEEDVINREEATAEDVLALATLQKAKRKAKREEKKKHRRRSHSAHDGPFRPDITPLDLFARFLKFYRYFDYEHYCVTAFGPLRLNALSTATPYDLSRLEVREAHTFHHKHSTKNNKKEEGEESDDAARQEIHYVHHHECSSSNSSCCTACGWSEAEFDRDFLGLTSEGQAAIGHLLRRRRPPLFTVSGVKHLLHEVNTAREAERWNWYEHPFDVVNGSCCPTTTTSNNNSHHSRRTHAAALPGGDTASESGREASRKAPRGSFVHLARRGCASADSELVCPSCNTALFPVRCMNVLDPLRWSSNMVRGVCRNHLQRILRAFERGLQMFDHASRELDAEQVNSNNDNDDNEAQGNTKKKGEREMNGSEEGDDNGSRGGMECDCCTAMLQDKVGDVLCAAEAPVLSEAHVSDTAVHIAKHNSPQAPNLTRVLEPRPASVTHYTSAAHMSSDKVGMTHLQAVAMPSSVASSQTNSSLPDTSHNDNDQNYTSCVSSKACISSEAMNRVRREEATPALLMSHADDTAAEEKVQVHNKHKGTHSKLKGSAKQQDEKHSTSSSSSTGAKGQATRAKQPHSSHDHHITSHATNDPCPSSTSATTNTTTAGELFYGYPAPHSCLTGAEVAVLRYLFGNTIDTIQKYSGLNCPWPQPGMNTSNSVKDEYAGAGNRGTHTSPPPSLNMTGAPYEYTNLQSGAYSSAGYHSPPEQQRCGLLHHGDVPYNLTANEAECATTNSDMKLSRDLVRRMPQCRSCHVPSLLCAPDIPHMCEAQFVFAPPTLPRGHANSRELAWARRQLGPLGEALVPVDPRASLMSMMMMSSPQMSIGATHGTSAYYGYLSPGMSEMRSANNNNGGLSVSVGLNNTTAAGALATSSGGMSGNRPYGGARGNAQGLLSVASADVYSASVTPISVGGRQERNYMASDPHPAMSATSMSNSPAAPHAIAGSTSSNSHAAAGVLPHSASSTPVQRTQLGLTMTSNAAYSTHGTHANSYAGTPSTCAPHGLSSNNNNTSHSSSSNNNNNNKSPQARRFITPELSPGSGGVPLAARTPSLTNTISSQAPNNNNTNNTGSSGSLAGNPLSQGTGSGSSGGGNGGAYATGPSTLQGQPSSSSSFSAPSQPRQASTNTNTNTTTTGNNAISASAAQSPVTTSGVRTSYPYYANPQPYPPNTTTTSNTATGGSPTQPAYASGPYQSATYGSATLSAGQQPPYSSNNNNNGGSMPSAQAGPYQSSGNAMNERSGGGMLPSSAGNAQRMMPVMSNMATNGGAQPYPVPQPSYVSNNSNNNNHVTHSYPPYSSSNNNNNGGPMYYPYSTRAAIYNPNNNNNTMQGNVGPSYMQAGHNNNNGSSQHHYYYHNHNGGGHPQGGGRFGGYGPNTPPQGRPNMPSNNNNSNPYYYYGNNNNTATSGAAYNNNNDGHGAGAGYPYSMPRGMPPTMGPAIPRGMNYHNNNNGNNVPVGSASCNTTPLSTSPSSMPYSSPGLRYGNGAPMPMQPVMRPVMPIGGAGTNTSGGSYPQSKSGSGFSSPMSL